MKSILEGIINSQRKALDEIFKWWNDYREHPSDLMWDRLVDKMTVLQSASSMTGTDESGGEE